MTREPPGWAVPGRSERSCRSHLRGSWLPRSRPWSGVLTATGGKATPARRAANTPGAPALRMTTIWAVALGAAGVAVSAVVYLLTADVIWSVVPLLLSVAGAHRVREHR